MRQLSFSNFLRYSNSGHNLISRHASELYAAVFLKKGCLVRVFGKIGWNQDCVWPQTGQETPYRMLFSAWPRMGTKRTGAMVCRLSLPCFFVPSISSWTWSGPPTGAMILPPSRS